MTRTQNRPSLMKTGVGDRMVHVRFEGRSLRIPLRELSAVEQPTEGVVLQALARHLHVPLARFGMYVVETHPNGNVTVRPEAVFG